MSSDSCDALIAGIADYVCTRAPASEGAMEAARLCLLDSLGCLAGALDAADLRPLPGPVVPGTVVPLGARVPGTPFELDPLRAAFNTGALIRWLDFSDTTVRGGHPSDTIGAVLACAAVCARLLDGRPIELAHPLGCSVMENIRDPQLDMLRERTEAVECPRYNEGDLDPLTLSCASAVQVEFADGAVTPRIEVLYPAGDASRRSEALPKVRQKFMSLVGSTWNEAQLASLFAMASSAGTLDALPVRDFQRRSPPLRHRRCEIQHGACNAMVCVQTGRGYD